MNLRIKKIIFATCILAAVLGCKKKKSEDPFPAPGTLPENIVGNESPLPGCQARTITEMKNGSVVSLVKITYTNGRPATIKIDSSGEEKINLVLDNKGSIKSGTLPVPYNGTSTKVSFQSANTYNSGLLVKAVQTTTISSFVNVAITNYYAYDNNSNLVLLVRTTIATIAFLGTVQESLKDSIVYSGYVNGRPAGFSKYSKNVKAGNPYTLSVSESYEYDGNMNRTKVNRNGVLKEETIFSEELFPGKIAYLTDLDGNPNYGNKDQDLNFMQTQKTFKSCTSGPVYDLSNVTSFQKSGSCIANAELADTTASCGTAGSPSSRNYIFTY